MNATSEVRLAAILVIGLLSVRPASAQTDDASRPCAEDPAYATLDFWVGDWTVLAGGNPVGTNRIEKILDGCAILEHWTSGDGGEGKSLFYYQKATDSWKQVWVTGQASLPGGLKEKLLVERFEDGGVRFQGEIPLPDGGTYLDRTTLTPQADGSVRQVIEVSRDGESWRVTFDAIYERDE